MEKASLAASTRVATTLRNLEVRISCGAASEFNPMPFDKFATHILTYELSIRCKVRYVSIYVDICGIGDTILIECFV